MDDIQRALLGNLSLKSSVLRTKGENLTNQFMIASNMLSHYQKIQHVKPTVDTRPPKSMLFSTNARDQRLRSLNKSNNQAVLAIKAILSVKNPNLGYLSPTIDSQKLDGRSIIKSKPAEAEPTDLLDLHSHKFTPTKPFQPRTKRTDHPSKLSQLRVYNPPPRARSANPASRPATRNSLISLNSSRSVMSHEADVGTHVTMSDAPNAKSQRVSITRTTLDDMTLLSLPPTSPDIPNNLDVPPLNISVDKDNQLWQKILSDRRSNKSGVESSSGNIDPVIKKQNRQAGKENANVSNSSSSLGVKNIETADLKSLEEDCKYIEFLQEVTDDIIKKGSYTNKVLTKIFEYHVDKNAHKLRETRMREMLRQLRLDLGVSHNEPDLVEESQTWGDLNENSPKILKKRQTEAEINSVKMHQTINCNSNRKTSKSPLNSSQSTNHSKASRSLKSSRNGGKIIHELTSNLMLNESNANESMDNVREWLDNTNNNNENNKIDSIEQKSNQSLKEKSESKIKSDSQNNGDYNYDYDDEDTTIASISSLDDNYQDTKDLLDYYNSTVSHDSEERHSNNNRLENGFNRTSLSDIPEMSYRSEMAKQMSIDNDDNKNEGSNKSPSDKHLTVSGPEGDSSSRISSSRSRRRAKMAKINANYSNVVDSVAELLSSPNSYVGIDFSIKSNSSKKSTIKNAAHIDKHEPKKDKSDINVKGKNGDDDDDGDYDDDDDQNDSHENMNIPNVESPALQNYQNYKDQVKFNSSRNNNEDDSEDGIEEECSIAIDYSSGQDTDRSDRKIMKEDDF